MKTVALCAGIGGLELGVSLVQPIKVIAYVESDPYCKKVLSVRHPDAEASDDVKTYHPPKCTLITAGFPCQPWSAAGKKKGTEDERWLWPHIGRIVREAEPRYVFLENVPNLVKGGLQPILRDLAAMGFDAEWGMFSCRQLGATHTRKRFFLLAYTNRPRQSKPRWDVNPSEPEHAGPVRVLADADPTKPNEGLESIEQLQPTTTCPTFWPPGPLADWTGLRPWPSEPGIPRVADGVPSRLEQPRDYCGRVRSLGNAVSPPVAAVAWSTLLKRLTNLS